MAYPCKLSGVGECDGCGKCNKARYICPVCESEEPKKLYEKDGEIIGCSDCIEVVDGEDYLD